MQRYSFNRRLGPSAADPHGHQNMSGGASPVPSTLEPEEGAAALCAVSRPRTSFDRRSPKLLSVLPLRETFGRRLRQGRETCAERRYHDGFAVIARNQPLNLMPMGLLRSTPTARRSRTLQCARKQPRITHGRRIAVYGILHITDSRHRRGLAWHKPVQFEERPCR